MKKKQTVHVKQDQAFLQGINLVTGLKINYDRPVLTEHELNALCIDEKYSKKQKAIKILKSGQALQKWSLFQNLAFYLTTPKQYEQILLLIEKYFQDLQPMLDIIAVGLSACINYIIETFQLSKQPQNNQKPFYLSQKGEKSLFRLCMRSFTDQKYNKVALQDWSVLFDEFFIYLQIAKSPRINEMIQECLQYISGSFSMNTAPERRRIAFQMIKGLIEHSQKVKQRAKTKASFFNNDTNSKTRTVICQSMGKLLNLQPGDEQIRKFVIDYFHDSDAVVRQKAFFILLNIQNEKHIQTIFDSLQQETNQISNLVIDNLQNFITNFSMFINPSKKYRNILSNLINSVLKSNDLDKISKIFKLLLMIYKNCYVNQKQKQNFFDVFMLEQLDYQEQIVFKALIQTYKESQSNQNYKQIQKVLQFYVQKNIKSAKNKQNFSKNISNLRLYLSIFTYESDQQNNIYVSFLTKMVDQSKWAQIQFLLQQLKRVPITEQNFEKITVLIVRLILNSPYFLVQIICKSILYLLLCKRKHLEFFLSIKQKLMTSKTWWHRRNYLILYSQLKTGSSYQFHKIVPPLNYKLITKQKCCGVKMQFLKYATKIYQSIDPNTQLQKIALKEAVIELCNQKDQDLNQLARQVSQKINDSQIDFCQIQKIAQRNILFLAEQQKMRQKQALMLKKNKTQRELGRKDSKSKTITVESRTSLRIPKDSSKDIAKKDISIVNVQKLKRPSTVTGLGRTSLKSDEQKRLPNSTSAVSTPNNSSSSITRIFSGQMKPTNKISALRRQSAFKK